MSKKDIVGREDLKRVKPKHPNKKIRLVVGLPVSMNNMYYYKSTNLTAKAKNYINSTKAKVMGFIQDEQYKVEDSYVWQYLDIIVYMPDKRIRDSHNMLKLLMDSIEGVLFHNDYCIMPRIQSVELDRKKPRLEMILSNQTKAQRNKAIKDISKC